MTRSIDELVERLQDALEAMDWMGRKVHPALRKPASAKELKELEGKLKRKIPETWKTFLKMHNGMEGLEQYEWGVAGATPPSKGEDFQDVRDGFITQLEKHQKDHPLARALQQTWVIGSDFDYQIVYFDPATWDADEPRVIKASFDLDEDQHVIFEDFAEYLAFVVQTWEEIFSFEDDEFGESDLALLEEISRMLDERSDAEPAQAAAPPPEMSPEMKIASQVCRTALKKLLDEELMELLPVGEVLETLEDRMIRILFNSRNQRETVENWITALSKAREVEELYGTDEELQRVFEEAFEEVERNHAT